RAGAGTADPIGRWTMGLITQTLYDVARGHRGHQWQYQTIDLGAHTGVANIGMQGVSEINGRGPARQGDQPAPWGETEDLVLEELELGVFKEVFGGDARCQVTDGLTQRSVSVGLHLDAA